jgi:hypothetical protein
MMAPPGGVPFFRDFPIERVRDDNSMEVLTFRLNGLTKAQFVDPPMDTSAVGFAEHYAQLVMRNAGERVWGLFARRARHSRHIPARIDEQGFWNRVKLLAQDVGAEPLLIVSRRAQGRALRTIVRETERSTIRFTTARKTDRDVGGTYVATIEGVDVYGAEFKHGKAWLFSPYLLQSLQYATIDEDHILRVGFQPGEDGVKGPLVAEFIQRAAWADWTVYEIDHEDPDGVETQ